MENYELAPDRQLHLEKMYERQCLERVRYVYPVRKLVCPGCGRIFYTQEHSRKYCQGEACARLYRKKLRRQERTDMVCACCGKHFDASRKDAKFCCNACRQRAYRVSAGVTDDVSCQLGNLHPSVTQQ